MLILLITSVLASQVTIQRSFICGCSYLSVDECITTEWCALSPLPAISNGNCTSFDVSQCVGVCEFIDGVCISKGDQYSCVDVDLSCSSFDQSTCNLHDWCLYDITAQQCNQKNLQCSMQSDEGSCKKLAYCKYDNQTCQDEGGPADEVTCDQVTDNTTCPTKFQGGNQCYWNSTNQCQLSRTCSNYTSEDSCLRFSNCAFSSDTQSCSSCLRAIYTAYSMLIAWISPLLLIG